MKSSRANDQQKFAALLKIQNLTRQTEVASCAQVADTAASRNKGLLGRSSLPSGGGLWIIPCNSVHTFFMKFPIDLIYLNRRKKVRKVCGNVGAWRISACLFAHSILELPAGTIHNSGTQLGDQLEFAPSTSVSLPAK